MQTLNYYLIGYQTNDKTQYKIPVDLIRSIVVVVDMFNHDGQTIGLVISKLYHSLKIFISNYIMTIWFYYQGEVIL